ncbi:MAG: hypothetical protein ACOC7N_00545 [Chloroflexota bacterium]
MAVQDVVDIVLEYCQDGEETFRNRRGVQAVVVVRDVIELLRRELGAQLDFNALWADFQDAPRQTAPELSGALEALVEADPGFAEGLDALLHEFYATRSAAEPRPTEPEEVPPAPEPPVQEEEEPGPRRHTDEAGEGAYLYGNVPAGATEVGERPDLEPEGLGVNRRHDAVNADVGALFDQLRTTVGEELPLADAVRRHLTVHLERLQAELALGDDADEDSVVYHLRRIGALDPDVLDLVLTGLRHTGSRAHGTLERAIRDAAREGGDQG